MSTQFSQQDQIPDPYRLSCQIHFLAEAIPAWIKDTANTGISQHVEDVAYGLETILKGIAKRTALLNASVSGNGGQGNDS